MTACVRTPLFVAGEHGIHTYRIPALLSTPAGTTLAFCEGRRHGQSDTGDIVMLVRRSTDGGDSWSPQTVVWDDTGNTCGNPCPVVDQRSGVIYLLMTWNLGTDRESQIIAQTSSDTRRVFVTSSRDDGLSWGPPREITAAVKQADWTWYATGPGAGIQLERGPRAGRLVIPCDHIEAGTGHYYSHVIYSDDGGGSWQLGGSTPQHQVNECEVVELEDGRLLLNMRNYDRRQAARQTSWSTDGGHTWSDLRPDPVLVEPLCQASIRRICWSSAAGPGAIVFSNPAATDDRGNMTVRLSRDDGATWSASRVLHAGPAAYSSLAALPDGRVGCLFECGEDHRRERLELARFPLAWVEQGTDA